MKEMKRPATLLYGILLLLPVSCTTAGRLDPLKLRQDHVPQIEKTIRYRGPDGETASEGKYSVDGRFLHQPENSDESFGGSVITAKDKEVYLTSPGWGSKASTLDTTQTYHFEALSPGAPGGEELVRISKDGRVLIDNSICEVQQRPMKRQIGIARAMGVYPDQLPPKVWKKEFPNDGNEYVGCGIPSGNPRWKCSACSRAYHAWVRKHGVDDEWR